MRKLLKCLFLLLTLIIEKILFLKRNIEKKLKQKVYLNTNNVCLLPRCRGQILSTLSVWKSGFKNEIFLVSRNFFFMNFDLKNSWKNEFKDNKEKSCSWSRKRVSHKIDFKAVGPRNGHADSVGVNDLKKLISTNWCKIHNKKAF